MKPKRVVLILSLILLPGLLTTTELANQQPSNAAGASDAAKLFEQNCAKCHGKDGRAKTVRGKMHGARNLTDAKWQAKETDEGIAAAIKKGPEAMPSFEKKFSQAQIDSLVAYVRSLKREEPEKKK
jgi:cbb3-type cytochrome c oxidase subunit III